VVSRAVATKLMILPNIEQLSCMCSKILMVAV
jgi:hypothetical protein